MLSFYTTDRGTTYESWMERLMPDGETSPTLGESMDSWKKIYPSQPLRCVYSRLPGLKSFQAQVVAEKAYLWIGQMPEKMAVMSATSGVAHAAVLYPRADGTFRIVHPLDPHSKMYVVEFLTKAEMQDRTFAIFEVSTVKPD